MNRVRIVPGWLRKPARLRISLRSTCEDRGRLDRLRSLRVGHQRPRADNAFAADGSIIIFDDWFAFRGHPHRGERRAFDEWRQRHPELIFTPFQQEGTWRMSFIVSFSE